MELVQQHGRRNSFVLETVSSYFSFDFPRDTSWTFREATRDVFLCARLRMYVCIVGDALSFRLLMQADFISDFLAGFRPGESGVHHLHFMAANGHVNKLRLVSQAPSGGCGSRHSLHFQCTFNRLWSLTHDPCQRCGTTWYPHLLSPCILTRINSLPGAVVRLQASASQGANTTLIF